MTWMITTTLLVYTLGTAWQDLRTRRVRNVWNVSWILIFLVLHALTHTLWLSVGGLLGMTLAAGFPAWVGWWGGGDWKIGMALGAAVGLVPACLLFALALLTARLYRARVRRISARWMNVQQARWDPLGVYLMAPTVGYAIVALWVR